MKLTTQHVSLLIFVLSAFFFTIPAVFAVSSTDPFVGKYIAETDDGKYYLNIKRTSDGHYKGELNIEGDIIFLSAIKRGNKIVGEMNDYGEVYAFMTTLRNDGSLNFSDETGKSLVFRPHKTTESHNKINTKQASAAEAKSAKSSKRKSDVYINRIRLDVDKLNALETTYQTRIEKGHYWYDRICGAWGVENGPTAGFIMAGLDLPGPMPSDISGGGIGIFINGREIHPLDQQGLQKLFGITYTGKYWLDAQGNLGVEGGPAILNIMAAIQASQRQHTGGAITHGYGSGYGARGSLAGDGQGGHIYSGRSSTGKSVFWYPGM
ncbi:MAG: hypothetical protein ABIJ37_09220 [Pseudomonadota bacterium]